MKNQEIDFDTIVIDSFHAGTAVSAWFYLIETEDDVLQVTGNINKEDGSFILDNAEYFIVIDNKPVKKVDLDDNFKSKIEAEIIVNFELLLKKEGEELANENY